MNINFFSKISNKLQSLSLLKDGSNLSVNAFDLEHWLFYHNLAGSFDDLKQRKFKDLKQDIFDAFQFESSLTLALALKIPPLHFQNALNLIFIEVVQKFPHFKKLLLPNSSEQNYENSLFNNDDWQVRANLANIITSLKIVEATPFIEQCLNAANDKLEPDFLYLAIALAQLSPGNALKLLPRFLMVEEFWIRIDSAYALSGINNSRDLVLRGLLIDSSANDYLSIIIANNFDIKELILSENQFLFDCACEIIYQYCQLHKTESKLNFSNKEIDLIELNDYLLKNIQNNISTISLWSLFELNEFNNKSYDIYKYIDHEKLIILINECLHDTLISNFELSENINLLPNYLKIKRAINLIKKLKLAEFKDSLIKMLDLKNIFCGDIIEALAQLDEQLALINFANIIIDKKNRFNDIKLKSDIVENNTNFYNVYSILIENLKNSSHNSVFSFFLVCFNDYSPSIRMLVLDSIINFVQNNNLIEDPQFLNLLKLSLNDPAYQVCKLAVKASGDFKLKQYCDLVINHLKSPERSLRDEAYLSLSKLTSVMGKDEIINKVNAKLIFEFNFTNRAWFNNALLKITEK